MKQPTNPKVGSAYRIINPSKSQGPGYFSINDIVYLVDDDGTFIPWFSSDKEYRCHGNSHEGNCHPISWSRLEPLLEVPNEEKLSRAFKIGDRVRILWDKSPYIGSGYTNVGIVTNVLKNGFDVAGFNNIDKGYSLYFKTEWLELIDQPENLVFQEGQLVTILWNKTNYHSGSKYTHQGRIKRVVKVCSDVVGYELNGFDLTDMDFTIFFKPEWIELPECRLGFSSIPFFANDFGTTANASGCPMPDKKLTGFYGGINTLSTADSPKRKGSFMTQLSTIAKRLVDSDTKTLIKAGYIDSCLDLTSRGSDALKAILFEANKKELVAAAKAQIKEDKDEE